MVVRTPHAIAGLGALLLVVTAGLGWGDAPPAIAIVRHAYVVPVLAAAARFGFVGGTLAALAAVFLAAPLVLPSVETTGLTWRIADALLLYPTLVVGGSLAGAVFTDARWQRARHDVAVDVQRILAARSDDLHAALDGVRARVAAWLDADVALVVHVDTTRLVIGAPHVAVDSLVAHVLASGASFLVRAPGRGVRFRRAFATPLLARGDVVGALAVERHGEIGREARRALTALGADIGLGLENARLAAVQRRFNDELARRVAEATAHVEAADRAKSTFVATASHELRTPLTAIQGFAELLAAREFPPAESRRLAAIVATEAQRLARIVADLLDLSRIERGLDLVIRPGRLDVRPALASALAIFRGERHHRLVVASGDDGLAVRADTDAFGRVVVNLVSNALKYSPAGTTVTVAACRVADGVEVSVADAGPGIPADALPRVFEPFYRVAGTAAPGTGIGLSVVKSLVEAHGGRVTLASAPGRGTRVGFVLPAAEAACGALVTTSDS
jgi:signal transduction histidine kinase